MVDLAKGFDRPLVLGEPAILLGLAFERNAQPDGTVVLFGGSGVLLGKGKTGRKAGGSKESKTQQQGKQLSFGWTASHRSDRSTFPRPR